MVRVAEVGEAELAPERHGPVAVDGGHADEEACDVALAQRRQELAPLREVLEDVREQRDVERALRRVRECVRLDVGDAGMRELRSCRLERPPARVDADDDGTCPLGDVVGDAADPAPDVEDTLARPDPVDEEVVVTGQPVLGMLALPVVDGSAVHRDVGVPVHREELAERLALVRLRPNRREPESEERSPEPVRKDKSKRPQRDTAADAAPDAPRGPATRGHRDRARNPATRPRSVASWKRAPAPSA